MTVAPDASAVNCRAMKAQAACGLIALMSNTHCRDLITLQQWRTLGWVMKVRGDGYMVLAMSNL